MPDFPQIISDLQIAKLIESQYNNQAQFVFQNDNLGVKKFPGYSVICNEGTHDAPDVIEDFEADMIYPFPSLKTSGVHAGFYRGQPQAIQQILPMISKTEPLVLCGHSKGAGVVNPQAGILLCAGFDLRKIIRVKFGSPNSNNDALEDALRASPCRSYWNYRYNLPFFRDPVGVVPIECSRIGFPYSTSEQKIQVTKRPSLLDSWGPSIGWHHLSLYSAAMEAQGMI